MKWTLPIVAIAAMPAAASDGPDTDFPHRDWGQVATLDMTLVDATACIAREKDGQGTVLVIPVDSGSDIDFSLDVPWGKKMEPWITYKLRSVEGATTLRVFYRRPYKTKTITKDVARLRERCLKVRQIDPA